MMLVLDGAIILVLNTNEDYSFHHCILMAALIRNRLNFVLLGYAYVSSTITLPFQTFSSN